MFCTSGGTLGSPIALVEGRGRTSHVYKLPANVKSEPKDPLAQQVQREIHQVLCNASQRILQTDLLALHASIVHLPL